MKNATDLLVYRKKSLVAKPSEYLNRTIIIDGETTLEGGFMLTKVLSTVFSSSAEPFSQSQSWEQYNIKLTDPLLLVNRQHSFIRSMISGVLLMSLYDLQKNKILSKAIQKLHADASELRTRYQLGDQKLTIQSGQFKRLHNNLILTLMRIMNQSISLREVVYEINLDSLNNELTPESEMNMAWVDLGYFLLYLSAQNRNKDFLGDADANLQLRRINSKASASQSIDDLLFYQDPWSQNMQEMICRALDISILHVHNDSGRFSVKKLGSRDKKAYFSLLTVNGRTSLILNEEIYHAIRTENMELTPEIEPGSPSSSERGLADTPEQSILELQGQLKSLIELLISKPRKSSQSKKVKPIREDNSAFQLAFNSFQANVIENILKHYDSRRDILQGLSDYLHLEVSAISVELLAQSNFNLKRLEHYLYQLMNPFRSQTATFNALVIKYSRPDRSRKQAVKLMFLEAWEKNIITHNTQTIPMCYEITKNALRDDREIKDLFKPSSHQMFFHKHQFRAFILSTLKENALTLSPNEETFEETSRCRPSTSQLTTRSSGCC